MADRLNLHQVEITGSGTQPIVLLHGFGCNRSMWRHLVTRLEPNYRLIRFDHMGTNAQSAPAYRAEVYSDLKTYARDLIAICRELELDRPIFIGHSVSATMGILAAGMEPELFKALVLVGPSPRYLNEDGYTGGFERADLDELMEALESNYLGWSGATAPAIMGNAERPQLGQELTDSFCQMDPGVAANFARVTFYSDNRTDLSKVSVPTLILQTKEDIIAPPVVGEYVHENIPGSRYVLLDATGHLPHLSAPEITNQAILDFLQTL